MYKLQAKLIGFDKNLEVIKTYKTQFRITYPLYVTWSFDWDGWDASDYDLYRIADVANKNGIPMTQLFNPRIYVKDQFSFNKTSPERADYLTQWVRQRQADYG